MTPQLGAVQPGEPIGDGQRWENYVVLADAHPELEGRTLADLTPAAEAQGGCCGTAATAESAEASAATGSACCAS